MTNLKKVMNGRDLALLLEGDLEVLKFRFDYQNFLMWPFIRYAILANIVFKNYFVIDFPFFAENSFTKDLFKKNLFAYIWHSYQKNPLRYNKEAPILMFSSGVVNVKEGDGYNNRLHDYFARLYPSSTLIIENSDEMKYRTPRSFPNVAYHDSFFIKAFLTGALRQVSPQDAKSIDSLLTFLRSRLPLGIDEKSWRIFKNKLVFTAKALPYLHGLYSRLFKKLRTKVVFLEDAGLGRRSFIIKWAKEAGLKTVELQHGTVSKNHPAYNYAPALAVSEYKEYLPDFFLTYGTYWDKNVTLPSKLVEIGSPAITEATKNTLRVPVRKHKKRVLIISSASQPELIKQVVLDLKNSLDNNFFEFYLRPHPVERSVASERYNFLKKGEVRLDNDPLYTSLHAADIIISVEPTTVLFEAIVFKKTIFLLRSAYAEYFIDLDLFECYSDSADLVEKIKAGGSKNYDVEQFWVSNWRERYQNFIENVVGIKP